MLKWTLILMAATLLVPSVARANDGTCYADSSCQNGDETAYDVSYETCVADGGLSWWPNYPTGSNACYATQ